MKICICTTPIRPQGANWPPFGAAAIIQSLQSIDLEAEFFNIDFHRYTTQEVKDYFTQNKFDIVGISAVVSTAYAYTKKLCSIIKSGKKDTIIIVGGALVASAHLILKKCNVDYCVIGDGEKIIINLTKLLLSKSFNENDLTNVKGLSFIKNNGDFVFTGYDKPLAANEIEVPDYSIFEKAKCINQVIYEKPSWESYGVQYKKDISKNYSVIITSKGCVARCTFCHRLEKGYRAKPVDNVIKWVEFLKRKYNVGYISIGDENFGSDKILSVEIARNLNRLGMLWACSGVRAYTVNPETLKLWKDNGCVMVLFGIESGSSTMLKVMEKKVSVQQNFNAIKWTYEAGLSTVIQLVIGMPGENDNTIQETIDFLIKCLPYTSDNLRSHSLPIVSINYAQALPGTPLYEYAREKGFIKGGLDGEEDYLNKISDVDAYEVDHFINYTGQPLLKVLTWRYWIMWDLLRSHMEIIHKLKLGYFEKSFLILSQISKFIFDKIGININYQNKTERKIHSLSKFKSSDGYINYKETRLIFLRLILPWNRFTYPIIAFLIAIKHADGLNKMLLTLILDHLKYSFSKKIPTLENRSLRKIISVDGVDRFLRLGR